MVFNRSIIPKAQATKTEAIAKKIFLRKIRSYKARELNEENVIEWTSSPDYSGYFVNDLENPWNTWNIHVGVYSKSIITGGFASLVYARAMSKLVHIETTPRRAKENWAKERITNGIIPKILEITVTDRAYKKINNIPENRLVRYKKYVEWNGQRIDVGVVANF